MRSNLLLPKQLIVLPTINCNNVNMDVEASTVVFKSGRLPYHSLPLDMKASANQQRRGLSIGPLLPSNTLQLDPMQILRRYPTQLEGFKDSPPDFPDPEYSRSPRREVG